MLLRLVRVELVLPDRLDGDDPVDDRIESLIDDAHRTLADRSADLILPQLFGYVAQWASGKRRCPEKSGHQGARACSCSARRVAGGSVLRQIGVIQRSLLRIQIRLRSLSPADAG